MVRFWWLTMISWASSRNSWTRPEEPLEVDVVEGGLHLVHQVEGRRPAPEHGEEVGQGHQRALATRQQGQAPHVAAGRTDLDLDPGVEQVLGVGQGEPAGASREERGHQGGEVLVDVGEGRVEDVHDLLVEGPDDVVELSTGGAHVLDLGLEEPVPLAELGELLEGQRVDRAQRGQLALELPMRAVGSEPSGSSGAGAAMASSGPQPSSRRRDSTTDSRRMVASTRSSSIFWSRPRTAASSCSSAERCRRSSSSRAPPARTASSWRRWRSRSSARAASSRSWAEPTTVSQPLDGGGVRLQPLPALGRLAALVGVPGQPALDLQEPLGQDPPAFDEAGRADLPLAAERGGLGDPLVDALALLAGRRRLVGRLGPGLLQAGQLLAELGRPAPRRGRSVRRARRGSGGSPRARRPAPPGRRPPAGGPPGPSGGPPRSGRRPGRPRAPPPWWPPRAERAAARSSAASAAATRGHLGPGSGLVDHRGGDHPAAGPHPPAGGREPVAVPGDHHQIGTGQGQIDGLRPSAQGAARPGEKGVEDRLEAGESRAARAGPHMMADRLGPAGRPGRPRRRPSGAGPRPEPASVRARTAPVAPPWRSRDSAALAGSLPETTTAATEAPAAASKASSQPASTSTRSRRVPTTPSTPASSSAPAAPRASSKRLLQGVGPGHRPVELLFGLAERLLGRLQPADGQARGPPRSRPPPPAADGGPARSRPGARPARGPRPRRPAARRSAVTRRSLSWSSDRRSRSRARSSEASWPRATVTASSAWRSRSPSPHASRWASSSAAISRLGPTSASCSGASAAASASVASSSPASRAPSASRVETTSASAAASRAWASDRCRSRSTPVSPRARSTMPSARARAEARSASRWADISSAVRSVSASSSAERRPQPRLGGPLLGLRLWPPRRGGSRAPSAPIRPRTAGPPAAPRPGPA